MVRRWFMAVFIALGSCGGDDGIDTGLPDDKMLTQLDRSEATRVCETLADAYRSRIDAGAVCVLVAIMAGEYEGEPMTREDCEAFRPMCIRLWEEMLSDPSECVDDLMTMSDPCEATVGDWEACAEEQLDRLAGMLWGLSCANVEDPTVLDRLYDRLANPSAACRVLMGCDGTEFGP